MWLGMVQFSALLASSRGAGIGRHEGLVKAAGKKNRHSLGAGSPRPG